MNHRARKRFGQHFLQDQEVIDHIVHGIGVQPGDRLVEIGPGKGALTGPLIAACPQLQVIELDRDLIPALLARFARYPEFKIHREDALKFEYTRLLPNDNNNTGLRGEGLRIVGNLPYNISTPLIFHLLSFRHQIRDMHFMLQKEVVERMAAVPGSKQYGRLSVMVQYYCRVDYLFDVPPECFEPRPKVDSAIVRLRPFGDLPVTAENPEGFSHLVNRAFQQRRKTLRNNLKCFLNAEQIESLPVDAGLRPENLSVNDYVELSNFINAL